MPNGSSLALLALIILVAVAAPLAAEEEKPSTLVRTEAGPVTGARIDDSIRVYKGIPFAAPPVGDLRWRPPQTVAPWGDPRECIEPGPACHQPKKVRWGEGMSGPESEDCLYLNVWTPAGAPDAKLPVMVWIHGGGFTIGSGALRSYDGAAFAREGVVLVTINYRLGPFGFLGHPLLSKESERDVSGNYGLLDQIAALRWVKRNIAAFGGDPGNVTIFGESAGSVSVCCLMVSPLAEGLFHRAIAQSGGARGIDRGLKKRRAGKEPLEVEGLVLEKALGCHEAEDRLAALRAVPAERIMEVAKPEVLRGGNGMKALPVVDGWVLPDSPPVLFAAGKQHDVPFMAGSTADDGGVFTSRTPIRGPFAYRIAVRRMFGEKADRVLAMFPAETRADVPLTVRRLVTVSSFVAPARDLVRSMENVPSKAWLYHFTRVCARAEKLGLGATHGIEIPYVFGTAGRAMGFDETDRKLAQTMRAYWVAFARTGDPNGEGRPGWPAYVTKTDRHLEFGDRVIVGEKLFEKECDLLTGD